MNDDQKKQLAREASRLLEDTTLKYVLTVCEATALTNLLAIADENPNGDLLRLRYAEQIKSVKEIRRLLESTAKYSGEQKEASDKAPV